MKNIENRIQLKLKNIKNDIIEYIKKIEKIPTKKHKSIKKQKFKVLFEPKMKKSVN